MLFPKEPEKICPPHTKEKPCPQAVVCGARPPHKYGRPGELLSCDARGTTRRPVISSCRRQFSADPPLAPGFLKGPAGPLSRAAAASKLLRGSIRKQSGKTLSARRHLLRYRALHSTKECRGGAATKAPVGLSTGQTGLRFAQIPPVILGR